MNVFDANEVKESVLIYPVMVTLLAYKLSEITGKPIEHIVEDYSMEAINRIKEIDFTDELNQILGVD